jgi:hypothetical protein
MLPFTLYLLTYMSFQGIPLKLVQSAAVAMVWRNAKSEWAFFIQGRETLGVATQPMMGPPALVVTMVL